MNRSPSMSASPRMMRSNCPCENRCGRRCPNERMMHEQMRGRNCMEEPAQMRDRNRMEEPTQMRDRNRMEEPTQMRDRNRMEEPTQMRDRRAGCGCSSTLPTGSRCQLLNYINEVSFGAHEAALYLDTHPDDMEAMEYFRVHNEKRTLALEEFAKRYGPLVLSTAGSDHETCWEWMQQPWPWEGGEC